MSGQNWRPNWKDANHYPNHEDDGLKWLWEFLRRNCRFEKELPALRKWCALERQNAHDFNLQEHEATMASYAKMFGIQFALGTNLDPANDAPSLRAYEGEIEWQHGNTGNTDSIIPKDFSEASIKFDLSMPLDAQLERAKRQLYGMQISIEDQFGSFTLARREWRQFPRYLRVLDAIDAGASKTEQATFIFSLNEKPQPDDFKALKELTLAAKSMCRIKYRQLAGLRSRGYVTRHEILHRERKNRGGGLKKK